MSSKLLLTVSVNVKHNFIRQFTIDSIKNRDVIMRQDLINDKEDTVTHTGQKFDVNDQRRVRFLNNPKYVNPNVAKDLIAAVPPIASNSRIVWCDGGDEHVGHPKVYINLDKPGTHSCGYCGLRFYKEDHHD